MRPRLLSVNQLESLPVVYRASIPPDYRDKMDHMNMRWYLALYDEAGDVLFDSFGQTAAYYREHGAGAFDLEHHIHYLAEVRIGDVVAVRARLLQRTPKRLHYMLFMVNETRAAVASTFECVNSHADLTTRRTSPYPSHIAAQIDAIVAQHQALDWDAPISGTMQA